MVQNYNDQLLHLAEDLAQRLLPAFDTPTGTISDRFFIDKCQSWNSECKTLKCYFSFLHLIKIRDSKGKAKSCFLDFIAQKTMSEPLSCHCDFPE